MIRIRKSADRGHFDHGWLDTYHTFSFGDYFDPQHTSFRALRVMNEDRVQPGQGFGTHGHRDMEIITCVLAGALEHRDSLGNGSVLAAGAFQRMTAGTGIRHSEFNPSQTEPVHLYQIWILPEKNGLPPGYEERVFERDESADRLRLIASRDGHEGSMTIHQDANVYVARLSDGADLRCERPAGRYAWLQVMRGAVELNGQPLEVGDGAAVREENVLSMRAAEAAELLLFDLA